MGYYSEVAVMMYKEDYENLVSEIKAHKIPENANYTAEILEKYALELLDDGCTCPETYDYNRNSDVFVRLYWNHIKWYTTPYIAFIERYFYKNAVDFVRIGEEASDIEEHYNLGRYEIGINRYLSFY